jgi:hypothetical protein
MSLAIYSKADIDKWEYYKEVGILNEEVENNSISTSSEYYGKYISPNAIHTTYSNWSLPHNLLFDCYDGDKSTFNRDDIGFIPPHILNKIVNSEIFKNKFSQINSDLAEQLELEDLYENQNDDDYYDSPDQFVIEKCGLELEILDFIIDKQNEGICWS